MDFLSDEIAKLKRKASGADGNDKRRSELEAQRQEEYRKDQERIALQRRERETEKLRRLQQHEARKRSKLRVVVKKEESIADITPVDITSVRQELLDLNEPICLFGETCADTMKRLIRLRTRNEIFSSSPESVLESVYTEPTDEDLPEMTSINIDPSWVTAGDDSKARLHENLFLLLRTYIRAWQDDAKGAALSGNEQSSKLYHLSRGHLSQLLARLKANNLPFDILTNLAHICLALNRKDYTLANQTYLQVSIGKATWPVGVTMVGIHERAQKERKHKEADGAHILSDEITRQWLHSLKRLITHFEQENKP